MTSEFIDTNDSSHSTYNSNYLNFNAEMNTSLRNITGAQINPSSYNHQVKSKEEIYGILKYERIIGGHFSKNEKAKTADFITEVNDYLMSGGSNNIINIYKIDTYNYLGNMKLKEWPYNISIINNNKIACLKNEIIIIKKKYKKR